MKNILNLYGVVFGLSFLLGLIVFFPLNNLKYPIMNMVSKNMGADLQIGYVHIGTGLGLGLGKGSLMAIKADQVLFSMPQGASFVCDQVVAAPHLASLLLGKLSVTVGCDLKSNSQIVAEITTGLFNQDKMSVEMELENIDLSLTEGLLQMGSPSGVVNGLVSLKDFNPRSRRPPEVSWNIKGKDIVVPALTSDFINIPALPLGPVASSGSYRLNKLQIDDLVFGQPKTPLEGQFKINFTLEGGQPIAGEWSGNLRSDPDFESTQFKDIKLDLLFGKVKGSGRREFVKKVEGSVLSLMKPPAE